MSDPGGPRALYVHAAMYCSALFVGLTLVLIGHVSAVEASGYVAPFLVIFERRRS